MNKQFIRKAGRYAAVFFITVGLMANAAVRAQEIDMLIKGGGFLLYTQGRSYSSTSKCHAYRFCLCCAY